MDINFEYHEVQASNRLEQLVGKKLENLADKYDFIIRSDVFFKKENTSEADKGLICEVRLSVPGPYLFAKSSQGSFDNAIAEVIREIDRQLHRKKEKMKSF